MPGPSQFAPSFVHFIGAGRPFIKERCFYMFAPSGPADVWKGRPRPAHSNKTHSLGEEACSLHTDSGPVYTWVFFGLGWFEGVDLYRQI